MAKSIFIELDKPRELRLTLRGLKYLETVLNVESLTEIIGKIEKGSFSVTLEFFIACLLFPKNISDALEPSELMILIDEYLCEKGLAESGKLVERIMKESVLLQNNEGKIEEKKK